MNLPSLTHVLQRTVPDSGIPCFPCVSSTSATTSGPTQSLFLETPDHLSPQEQIPSFSVYLFESTPLWFSSTSTSAWGILDVTQLCPSVQAKDTVSSPGSPCHQPIAVPLCLPVSWGPGREARGCAQDCPGCSRLSMGAMVGPSLEPSRQLSQNV